MASDFLMVIKILILTMNLALNITYYFECMGIVGFFDNVL